MKFIDTRRTWVKVVALVIMYSFIFEILYPLNYVFADTGAKQAESSGFSASSTSGLVDKFTGDFSYSLPVMDVEGYPIVLSYNQNVTMHSEASWVGLGWDLNVGSVSRDMRGIPDDFNGEDKIVKEVGQKDDVVLGAMINKSFSYSSPLNPSSALIGSNPYLALFISNLSLAGGITLSAGSYYSSLNGVGNTSSLDLSFNPSYNLFLHRRSGPSVLGSFNLGFDADTQNGVGRSSNFGLGVNGQIKKVGSGAGLGFSRNFNSRTGNVYKSINPSFRLIPSYNLSNKANGSIPIGMSLGGAQKFGSITTLPSVTRPIIAENSSITLTLSKFSNTLLGSSWEKGYGATLYSTNSSLNLPKQNKIESSAYGYFHYAKRNPNSKGDDYPVMDFNQSSINEYSEEMNALPFSTPTFDVFSYSSSIGGGAFRAQRSDVGTLMDATVESINNGNSNTILLGLGKMELIPGTPVSAGKVGYIYGDSEGGTETGNWQFSNDDDYYYEGKEGEAYDYSVFFKASGELTPRNTVLLDEYGGLSTPLHRVPEVDGNNANLSSNKFSNGVNQLIENNSPIKSYSAREEIRAVYHNPSTAKQEVEKGRENFVTYPENTLVLSQDDPQVESINRVDNYRKKHHLSAVEIVGGGGEYSYFGIPAYNFKQDNVVFSMAGKLNETYFNQTGYVAYDHGVDNSVNNSNGRYGFYERNTIPGYAHSFLLSEIRSSDYVDLGNDGLTPDDQGDYYKFNYTRLYDENNPFTWRSPVSGVEGQQDPVANMDRGLLATEMDDMGSYTYGEKEMWYVNSVESKHMVAQFYISEESGENSRKDAYAVNEKGFLDFTKSARKLDSIALYNKHDLMTNPETAKPLQVVMFIYDYSLCKNYEKNWNTYNDNHAESGKLTLREVRIKTGHSDEQALYPYVFDYSEENEDFNVINVDNWGNYKKNDVITYPNLEYPYVRQWNYTDGVSYADDCNKSAKQWKLTKITNPIGGVTEIEYEADSYSYVQNKSAMDLYKVHGYTNMIDLAFMNHQGYLEPRTYERLRAVTNDVSSIVSRYGIDIDDFNFAGFDPDRAHTLPNNVVVFKLRSSYSGASKIELEQQLKDDYFRDPSLPGKKYYSELYLKTRVKIKKDSPEEEDIPAFIDIATSDVTRFNQVLAKNQLSAIKNIGLLGSDSQEEFEYAYVVLDLAQVKDDVSNDDQATNDNYNVNPIQKNAWEFARLNLPDLMYADCSYDEATNSFDCDYSLSIDWKVVFGRKLNKILNRNDFCNSVDVDHSFVRLNANQDENFGIKYASTARVKQVKYYDKWGEMSGEYDSEYIWNYSYASASPEVTGESTSSDKLYYGVAAYEPFIGKDVNPFYTWSRYKNKKQRNFPDESRYIEEPAAELVFPAPIVGYEQTVVAFQEQESSSKTGKSISRYLTAKSHPLKVRRTEIDVKKDRSSKLALFKAYDVLVASQGYLVETNNYHGLISENEVIDALSNTQAKTSYRYNNVGDNKVSTIDSDGQLNKEAIGLEYDVYFTSNFSLSQNQTMSIGLSAMFTFSLPPLIVPTPVFKTFITETGVYANTLNKVVHHSAVLDRVETSYLGSKNMAKNEIYDRYSGNVIMSSLLDEYDDKLISLNYPAHWYYDNFRNIHQKQDEWNGIEIINGSIASGVNPSIDNTSFTEGDILFIENEEEQGFVQVLVKNNYAVDPQNPTLSACHLIELQTGTSLASLNGENFSIKRIKSGRTNRIGQVMQQVTTKDDSFYDLESNTFAFPTDNILSVNAVSFKENRQLYCDKVRGLNVGDPINPFLYGVKGHYRITNSFAFQEERVSDDPHQTRFNGKLDNYVPFYAYNPIYNSWRKINQTGHPEFVNENNYGNYRMLGDVTKFDEYAKPLEQVDQIGVHGTALYGYNDKLKLIPIAQAMNAKNSDIAYVSFEDNMYLNDQITDVNGHFSFNQELLSGKGYLSTDEYHTGKMAYALVSGETATVSKEIIQESCVPDLPDHIDSAQYLEIIQTYSESTQFSEGYKIAPCDCVQEFNPTPGKYVLSAWVRVPEQEEELTYTSGEVVVELTGGSSPSVTILPEGPIIDGWQRLEGVFEVTDQNSIISVSLKATDHTAYFDDLRIHPFHASMVTTVYDPTTLLPLARHDAYNFATFYNYDENLSLSRIRIETIEGIKTITEQESGGVKRFVEVD